MFGENCLLNVDYCKVDNKTRVVLPSYSKAEPKENIVLLKEENYVNVWSGDKIVEKLRLIDEKKDNAINEKMRKEYQDLSDGITAFAKTCIVDNQGRIALGKDILKEYGIEKYIVFEGKDDHLRLWEPKKFEEYRNNLRKEEKGRV